MRGRTIGRRARPSRCVRNIRRARPYEFIGFGAMCVTKPLHVYGLVTPMAPNPINSWGLVRRLFRTHQSLVQNGFRTQFGLKHVPIAGPGSRKASAWRFARSLVVLGSVIRCAQVCRPSCSDWKLPWTPRCMQALPACRSGSPNGKRPKTLKHIVLIDGHQQPKHVNKIPLHHA